MGSGFYYVYILKSVAYPDRHYTGHTDDLDQRLTALNASNFPHTSKFLPWTIEITVAFRSMEKAISFERYLKTHSGRAFCKKHF